MSIYRTILCLMHNMAPAENKTRWRQCARVRERDREKEASLFHVSVCVCLDVFDFNPFFLIRKFHFLAFTNKRPCSIVNFNTHAARCCDDDAL